MLKLTHANVCATNDSHVPPACDGWSPTRAGRCEYCRVPMTDAYAGHEVDHNYAEKHGGETSEDNLCLSCWICNRLKVTDLCSSTHKPTSVRDKCFWRIDLTPDPLHYLGGVEKRSESPFSTLRKGLGETKFARGEV